MDGHALEATHAEGEALLTSAVGLHARPAIKLTKLAKAFSSRIVLRAEGGASWCDAKSIVRVMALKVPRGAILQFKAEGGDAPAAIAALVALVERNFEDAPAD